ncbi:MAG: type II CRISPR RNA-guided endonuclease Cas9 [Candidatus Coprovivens sp.]
MNKKYNIGLDIGTTSVGWAVVESDTQKIIRKGKGKNRKALWGVRLFEEASTAEGRRSFRSTRRRYDRRRNRIKLLQEEFKNEMNNVDRDFFKKLEESKYHVTDKFNKTVVLTAEEKKMIREYNNQYKTIYHLRSRLINDDSKADIRLVYLAIHHIIKYRGNFLYAVDNFNVSSLNIEEKIREVMYSFVNLVPALGISDDYENIVSINKISQIMINPSKNDVKVELREVLKDFCNSNKFATEFCKMIVGNKFNLKDLFALEEINKLQISFDGTDYDDKYEELENILGDKIETLDLLKQLYDTLFLKKLFKGKTNVSLSELMVDKYNQHKNDLSLLKQLFRYDRKKYNLIFRSVTARKKDNNHTERKEYICYYEQYIHNKISFYDLSKELDKYIPDLLELADLEICQKWNSIKERYANGDFLPRITDSDNGKYPYQLNKDELVKIIENQGKYYPFLLNEVNDKYRIVKLLEFKIPYYVGPLVSDKKSDFAWMERITPNVKITPFNFDDVVDKETTAEKFIKRMISHCSYLLDEYALPNNSILYSRYKVMNELKQIKVNGNKIPIDIQHKILNDYFMKTSGTITDNKFKSYLRTLPDFGMYENDINVTGYSADGQFANNMQSFVDFFGENGIFESTSYNEEDADQIIEWITIFDDKDVLEKKVRKEYNELGEFSIKKIVSKKYSGWGSLSKKLLCTPYYKDRKSGISKSILDLMYETEDNFMQIINNDEYKFQGLIKEENVIKDTTKINYDLVKGLATSPSTKKGIYQALKVVDEIVDYMGYEPENIMIEMSRNEDKKERKDDRKKYLTKLYDKFKEEINNYSQLSLELDDLDKIDTTRLFLYFIQEGKCLYTGKPLNVDDLSSYEIDHIIPRTLIKDDSLDNKALVLRECNQTKKDSFVLPSMYNTFENRKWWQHLKKIGLMSAKKFHNLIRTEYSDEDIQDFINRQLVETRQITKHVANILNNFYENTKIVYLKANLSHNYRERYELFKFREINDYHHAHDAYLAAVLGEYKEKYMTRNVNYEMMRELNSRIKSSGNYKKFNYGFVINSLDNEINDCIYELSKNMINKDTGELLFDSDKFNKIVEDTLYRNDILISRKTEIRSGEFYNQTKQKKGGKGVPLKGNMPIELYGSYTSLNPSYAVMVSYTKKGKENRKMVGYPMYFNGKAEEDKILYYKTLLGLNENDNVEIYDKKIPFYSLINWNNQACYLVGASDNVEVCNSKQFKYSKEFMKKNKYSFNVLFNGAKYDDEENYSKSLDEIINYIVNRFEKDYVLFSNLVVELKKIVSYGDYSVFNVQEKENIIKQLTLLLNCRSDNANFKFLNDKYSSAFGKKNDRIIESCFVSNLSVTGLKESKHEF